MNAATTERWTYETATDGSLAASAFGHVGSDGFYQCNETFKLLGLPAPKAGAFYSQENSDRVYLTRFGLVLTVVYNQRNPFAAMAQSIGLMGKTETSVFRSAFKAVADEVLQPLLRIPLTDHAVLEINAGVGGISRGAERQLQVLKESLEEKGLQLINYQPETYGVIPDADNKTELGLIRNRRAVLIQPGWTQKKAVRQQAIFAEAIGWFEDALESGLEEKFAKAFNKCAQIVDLSPHDPRRVLVPYWAETTPHTLRDHDVLRAAQKYDMQFRA